MDRFLTGIASPLLEDERSDAGPVLESHHVAGDCARGHDHALCKAMDGGVVLPDTSTGEIRPARTLDAAPGAVGAPLPSQPHRGLHTPRGPPSS